MKKRKLLFYEKAPLRVLEESYGSDAAHAMYEITRLLSAHFRAEGRDIRSFYDSYLVSESEGGKERYLGKIASNRIPGCPVFYPLEAPCFPPNATDGFFPAEVPDTTVSAIEAGTAAVLESDGLLKPYYATKAGTEVTHQIILSQHHVPGINLMQIFGREALTVGDWATSVLARESRYRPPIQSMRGYRMYYARQYFGQELMYEGFIYSNLIAECPGFYPSVKGAVHLQLEQSALNANHGKLDVRLPNSIRMQLSKIPLGSARYSAN